MTAILVDDMPQAIQLLQNDLKAYCPEVEVIGTAESIVAAAKLLRQKTPDLIFLDISLGDGTGFDLLEIFPDISSKVIFVTASEEHAIKAFRFAAVDYLLKPIPSEDLQKAVQRAKKQLNTSNAHLELLKETIRHPDKLPKRISLHSLDRIVLADIDEIVRMESDVNNTRFFMKNGEMIYVTRTLKQFEDLLKDHPFLRVHQSHLININYIQEFSKKDGGFLKMKYGNAVPVAIRKKAEVMELLDRNLF